MKLALITWTKNMMIKLHWVNHLKWMVKLVINLCPSEFSMFCLKVRVQIFLYWNLFLWVLQLINFSSCLYTVLLPQSFQGACSWVSSVLEAQLVKYLAHLGLELAWEAHAWICGDDYKLMSPARVLVLKCKRKRLKGEQHIEELITLKRKPLVQ